MAIQSKAFSESSNYETQGLHLLFLQVLPREIDHLWFELILGYRVVRHTNGKLVLGVDLGGESLQKFLVLHRTTALEDALDH